MTTFFVFILLFLVLGILVNITQKKKHPTATSKTAGHQNMSTSQQSIAGDYVPVIIQQAGLQVLETVHIIGTSKALDTIKGRFEFLLQKIGTLQKGKRNPRYLSDIQKSIDTYKSNYYDLVLQDYEVALLLNPTDFDLTEFYCLSIFNAFKRNYEDHSEEIKILKRADAKIRRKEKIIELIKFTKDELNNKCSSSASFATIMSELAKIENTISSENSPPSNEHAIEQKSAVPVSNITSISAKQSASQETEFIINPGSQFELTLLGADKSLGKKIQQILLDEKTRHDKKQQDIVAIFAEYNLKVKEIEAYKEKYGPVYFKKIEELKISSSEWATSGEMDKEDLLQEFREAAVKEIYEQANCDLVSLFEKEPKDITIDDALIKEYGFENIQTYLRFADNIEKVRVIPNDNYNRQRFEKLVELGLSIRGSSIPLEEVLSTLTLKDLNEIAQNPEKQFKRKNQAIEFILTIPNIEEKIGSKISLRELFQLKALPEKFAAVNLQEVSNAWSYTYEVVTLLIGTYDNAQYSDQTLKDSEFVKEYRVECWGDDENMCPCAKELINKKFPKSKPPKIPFHIGCSCSLRQEYRIN